MQDSSGGIRLKRGSHGNHKHSLVKQDNCIVRVLPPLLGFQTF